MKKINKCLTMFSTLLLILTSLFSVAPAFADDATTDTVTLHKIVMPQAAFDNFTEGTKGKNDSDYVGKQINDLKSYFGSTDAKEIKGAFFVFKNETGTKFITENGKEVDTLEAKDAEGGAVLSGLTKDNGFVFNTAKLKGIYQIVELKEKSNYADKDLDYTDNRKDKGVVSATVGDKKEYIVGTKILKGSDYKKLVWTDSMTKGLTFNNNVKVTLDGEDFPVLNYKLVTDDQGFRLALNATGLAAVAAAAKDKDVEIKITYSATVNGSTTVEIPETNDVKLDYGNNPTEESEPQEGTPANQEIKVIKDWAVDGTITDANVAVKAIFTLQEKQTDGTWVNVASHEATKPSRFEHTFTGLDNAKTYRVVERVSGYTPEYVSFKNGVVTIKNNKNSNDPTPINPSEPKVVTYGRKFVKTNQANTERLAGATFLVKKEGKYLARKAGAATAEAKAAVKTAKLALDEAVKAYNDLTKEKQEGQEGKTALATVDQKQKAYNDAFVKANYSYEWVADKKADNVVKLISNAGGQFEITGLDKGTYGLEETQAPAGYATLSGDVNFEVTATSYSKGATTDIAYDKGSVKKDAQQVQNKKVTIPQTGGIGTILFTIIGLSIMLGAVVIMKKRQSEEA
ncbi:TPA: isopeptide-forming domain-containing fimbrial protein [Streptococcus agalactiae]|nr:isopeptide-forming domain-containing fimbrial protein [Streptococcus agalactiae]